MTGANTALEKLAEARSKDDLATVNLHEKNLAFNLGATSTTPCSGPTCPPTRRQAHR